MAITLAVKGGAVKDLADTLYENDDAMLRRLLRLKLGLMSSRGRGQISYPLHRLS